MEDKIVFKGQTEDGKSYVIRYIDASDAQAMTEYINPLSQERTFIRFQGEGITLEDEINYLQSQLKKVEQKRTIHLVVICEDKIIGVSNVDMKDKTESHEGIFGISLAKYYRGQGIGKILMDTILKEAEKNIPELRILTLGVFGDNLLAQDMYKKFGFQEFGRLPEGTLHNGKYKDHIYMYKKIK